MLYLTNQLPLPAHSGGQVRECECLRRLGQHASIDLAVVTRHFDRDATHVGESLEYCTRVAIYEALDHDGEAWTSGLSRRMIEHRSAELRYDLEGQFRERAYDVVHSEGYFLLQHLPTTSSTPVTLVAENIEHDVTLDDDVANARERALELAAWRSCQTVCAVAEHDAAAMRQADPSLSVRVTRMGFDHLATQKTAPGTVPPRRGPQVAFVGNFEWRPTRQAAERLLGQIWPRIAARVPDAELLLIGAGSDAALLDSARGTERATLVGAVASVRRYLESCDVFVAPLGPSTGSKVKIGEALTMGCAVVATRASVAGLPDGAEDAIAIGESDDDLAARAVDLLGDRQRRDDLRLRAREYAATLPTWDMAAEDLLAAWLDTAAGRHAKPLDGTVDASSR